MAIMITYHGYNDGCANPVYNVHQNMGVHCTWPGMGIIDNAK